MPAKVKVDSSTWGSVSDMYVKTGPSSWANATEAYVKVDGSTWTRWFLAAITDSFGRSTSGSLGNAETSQAWTNRTGTWYANGSQAQSDTAASSYPVASVTYPSNDVTVSASVGAGTGPAVWVTSSGDWYAAIMFQTQVNGTYSCNCSCNGSYQPYVVYCSQATCPPCTTTTSNVTTTVPCPSNTFTSITGWSYQGSAAPYRISKCTKAQVDDPSNFDCYTTSDCYSGGGGSLCYYACPGDQQTGHPGCCSCYSPIYTTTYLCAAGCTGGGGKTYDDCTLTSTVSTSVCNACSSPSFGVCGSGSYFVSGGTYPNCDGNGASCQTCGTLVNAYFLRILKSVGGTVTSPASDISLSSPAAAIKMTTSGNTITYQAYSDTSLSSPIGSQGSITETSPTKVQNYGIIKAPSSYGQSSTVDNFKVSG
jgi:hypothetical protein